MSERRHTLHWRPVAPSVREAPGAALDERLLALVEDRAATAAAIVTEASEALLGWLSEQALPLEGAELARGLALVRDSHGWRAPVVHWLEALEGALALAERRALPAAEVLAEELGLWLGGASGDAPDAVWDGHPLGAGRRMPERGACAPALVAELEPGERILVHGFSETVTEALLEVYARGLAPEVVLSEGGADLGGRRMARELAPRGVRVTLVYDAALVAQVPACDRIWLGTEAIGAQAFLGRVGMRALLEEARRAEVPSAVVATSDKLMPRGELPLPAWCERDAWLLWDGAPEGVRLQPQLFERVPLELPDAFATEYGIESAAEFSLRSLRTEAALSLVD